jgi:DNA topoisomerase-1
MPPVELAASARDSGLCYVADTRPGITRQLDNGGFQYFDAHGKKIRSLKVLERIKSLAIPPAWRNVWICADVNGHLQATGRDARGRKQYRYHSRWRKVRDESKYERTIAFARALPRIRRRVAGDLASRGLPREKVLATVVHLLETTLIRVGNDEYARGNQSYGLTTLQDRHAEVRADRVTFKFHGKSGKRHVLDVHNRKLARIIKRCRDLPGYELFQYVDASGTAVDVTSTDVNQYLHEISGSDFSAKDFRTWAGTVLAARALQEFEKFSSPAEAKRNLLQAVEAVARMLGNTPAICRRCYVHPIVLDTYLDGSLAERLQKQAERKLATGIKDLRPEEAAVLMLLQQTLSKPPAEITRLRGPHAHTRKQHGRTNERTLG